MTDSAAEMMDRVIRALPLDREEYKTQIGLILTAAETSKSYEDQRELVSFAISLAEQMGDDELVDSLSVRYLAEHETARDLGFFNAVSGRLRSLHRLHRHRDEQALVMEVVRLLELEDFVRLLSIVTRHHRGEIDWTAELLLKLDSWRHSETFDGLDRESIANASPEDVLEVLARHLSQTSDEETLGASGDL